MNGVWSTWIQINIEGKWENSGSLHPQANVFTRERKKPLDTMPQPQWLRFVCPRSSASPPLPSLPAPGEAQSDQTWVHLVLMLFSCRSWERAGPGMAARTSLTPSLAQPASHVCEPSGPFGLAEEKGLLRCSCSAGRAEFTQMEELRRPQNKYQQPTHFTLLKKRERNGRGGPKQTGPAQPGAAGWNPQLCLLLSHVSEGAARLRGAELHISWVRPGREKGLAVHSPSQNKHRFQCHRQSFPGAWVFFVGVRVSPSFPPEKSMLLGFFQLVFLWRALGFSLYFLFSLSLFPFLFFQERKSFSFLFPGVC